MKRILAGIAVAVFSTSLAFAAAEDPMASRYDNTVTITNAKNEVTKLHYNKDGTVAVTNPDGTKGTGKWAMKADKLCVTPDAGPMAGKEQCSAFTAGKKVGDSWDQTLADGSKVKVAIVAGRS
jgi:opacity protein-like surface antigen